MTNVSKVIDPTLKGLDAIEDYIEDQRSDFLSKQSSLIAQTSGKRLFGFDKAIVMTREHGNYLPSKTDTVLVPMNKDLLVPFLPTPTVRPMPYYPSFDVRTIAKGVTVIFGVNNSGKSVLLNGITRRSRIQDLIDIIAPGKIRSQLKSLSKSELLRFVAENKASDVIAKQSTVDYITYIEPHDDAVIDQRVMYMQIAGSRAPIIVIDALRDVIFSASDTGTIGSGGVNMGLWSILTRLDVITRLSDRSFIIALNPMSDDSNFIDRFIVAASSSVTTVIHAIEPGKCDITSKLAANYDRRLVHTEYTPWYEEDLGQLIYDVVHEPSSLTDVLATHKKEGYNEELEHMSNMRAEIQIVHSDDSDASPGTDEDATSSAYGNLPLRP